jgi:protoporphyrinogen oxidase
MLRDLPEGTVSLGERLESIDLDSRTARTSKRTLRYQRLVSSAPLDKQLAACGIDDYDGTWSWNKVLVFNLGFDRKGAEGVHWMYFPERALRFYRVGWYDNIMDADRMSLYVEIGAAAGETLDVDAERERVLNDLRREGIVDGHQLVSWHTVTLDPAYVHITRDSLAAVDAARARLNAHGVYPVGRYGRWTYCSIEDNMIETRALAAELSRR